jgi:hypothetical protein
VSINKGNVKLILTKYVTKNKTKLKEQISVASKNMTEKFAQTLQQHCWGKLEGREIVCDNET